MSRRSLLQSVKNSDNLNAKKISIGLVQDIQSIVDSENSTLLHLSANNNNLELAKHFVEAYNQLIEQHPDQFSNSTKKKWLGAKDNQGFSCLHYAVFRSNYDLALFLQEQGADIYQINNQGLTVLHIAAQGDSPLLMFYYLNKGLKLQVLDSKGSTPLHWACYSGQENAAFALISWNASIDLQQLTFGMTPLHLAVMSGNGRIVKKLLLKGCDRNIRNFNGKLPLDIAKQNQYINITDMIIDKRGIQQLLNIKTPFRKLHKHTLPFYIFLFLFLSNYILNVSFVVGPKLTTQSDLAILFLVLGFIVLVLYAMCYFTNPGRLKTQKTQGYFQMLTKNKANNICYDCKIVKPQRSRHCQICDTCICVYDHHCPWIANCVGAKNYCFFYSFLLSLLIFLGYTIIYEIINICEVNNWQTLQALEVIRIICEVFGILCGIVFFIPLIFLLTVQTRNALQNKTTFQRYGYSKPPVRRNTSFSISEQSSLRNTLTQHQSIGVSKGSSIQIPRRTGPSNCFLMCWGNRNNIMYQRGV